MAEPAKSEKIEFGTQNPLEMRAATGDEMRIEFGGPGGGFMARAGASIPTTTEGKVQFLESQFGEGNVLTTRAGEILIRDPATGSLTPFDERDITFKDITADLTGAAIEAVPGAIGGVLGAPGGPAGSVGGAAAGGAIGTAARIGAAELLTGGETGQTRGEQALDIGMSALISGATQGVVNLGAKVFDALNPRNLLLARKARKLSDKPFAKKGRRLSEKTGIEFTFGEETGSGAAQAIEALGRRTPFFGDDFFEFQQKQLRTAMDRLRETMEKVSPGGGGAFKAGSEAQTAFDAALDDAIQLRRMQASEDFAKVDQLSGGGAFIVPRQLVAEAQRLVDEMDVPGGGPATARLVTQAREVVKELVGDEGAKPLTASQVQNLLSVYTNAQRGTGHVFTDLPGGQTRLIAGRLKTALMGDLDAAGEAGAGEAVRALRVARDRYRVNTDAIRNIGDSVLSRVIGNGTRSPEAIAEKFIKMKPSEIADTMRIIEATSPEAAASVRRRFVEAAFENAKPPVSQQSAEGVKFSAARFVSSLPDMDIMKAVGFTRQDIAEIGQVSKALQRISDKAFTGSPTAFAAITWDAIGGLVALNPATIGRPVSTIITMRAIAKAALTPEGRKALLTLSETGPKTKAAVQAATNLLAIVETEPEPQNVRPLLPPDRANTERTMIDALKETDQ